MSNWNVDIDGAIIDLEQVQLITYNSVLNEICFRFINGTLYTIYYKDELEKGEQLFCELKSLLEEPTMKCPVCIDGYVTKNGQTEICSICNGEVGITKQVLHDKLKNSEERKKKIIPVKKRTGKKPDDLVNCPVCIGGLVSNNGYDKTCPVCNGYGNVSKRKLEAMRKDGYKV